MIRKLFAIDLRTLALFRVCVALLLLCDLFFRMFDLRAHYTDFGVMPRVVAINSSSLGSSWGFSLHLMSGGLGWILLLFIGAAVSAFMLLIGYQTRLFTWVSFVFLFSLQSRNWMITQSGDTLLRLYLFWGIFLPWGAIFSVDRALNPNPKPLAKEFFSIATMALAIQLGLVYFISGVLKYQEIYWRSGLGLYYALSNQGLATALGVYLTQHFFEILKFLGRMVVYFEIGAPLLIFVPFWQSGIRFLLISSFLCFHVSIASTLKVGLFSAIAIVGWLQFVTPEMWTVIFRWIDRPTRKGMKLYFDRDCDVCRKIIAFIQTFLILPGNFALPAQDAPSIEADMERYNSWVLVDIKGKRHYQFEALTYLIEQSPLLFWMGRILRFSHMQSLGTRCYVWFANHRVWASRFLPAWRENEPVYGTGKITQLFILACLSGVILFCTNSLPRCFIKIPSWADRTLNGLGLNQSWNMFVKASIDDGWFVIPGRLRNGKEVNLFFNSEEVHWEKPVSVSSTFPGDRWRKYTFNLRTTGNASHWLYYGQYLCRQWNSTHFESETLEAFYVYFIREDSLETGQKAPIHPTTFWKHECTSGGLKKWEKILSAHYEGRDVP